MSKFFDVMERKLAGPMAKVSEQKHLQAIRDGVVSALPFIIIGSLFLIIAFPPLPQEWAISLWAKKHILDILIPYRCTMFIMSLYISFGIGYNLSKKYKLDPLAGAQLSAAAFLFTMLPKAAGDLGMVLPMGNMGGHGLFVAILVSIFSVESIRFFKTRKLVIKMPDSVPASVMKSFEALIPALFVILVMTLITVVFKLDLVALVDKGLAPLVKGGNTIFGVLIPTFLVTFFWVFGIHGDSVVGSVVRPVWEVYLTKNAEAVTAGHAMPYIAPETFFQWFVWIGGSGATMGLVIAMVFLSKSKYTKAIGRSAIIPGLFNINEPVIFGAPIVLNPMLMIPFIVTPLITASLTYTAVYLHLLKPTYIMVPWTLPAPIGAYLSTGGDWRAVVVVLLNVFISFLVYLPFFKMYDNKLAREERATEEQQKVA